MPNNGGKHERFFQPKDLRPVRRGIDRAHPSMYNDDVLCMACKQKETERADYAEAVKAENDAVKRGDRNFKGKGF